MPKTSARPLVLLLHVELADIEPVIWRHLLVPASITLAHLHEALQATLGWHDMHLHEFHLQGTRYGVPDPEGGDSPPLRNEAGVTLAAALGLATAFSYVYDLGDEWVHQIAVTPYVAGKGALPLPSCVGGANAGPPEDTGGPVAYSLFVEAIANPQHPEHETMMDWHGQPFDPRAWDIERANRRLKRLRLAWERHDLNGG